MAQTFETIILQENLNPTVKLEPLTSYYDDQDENGVYTNCPTATEQSKIGEVFHVAKDRFKFVCVHCFAEFPLLVQFTAHVQQHLHHIYAESIDTKVFDDSDGADVKPMQLDWPAGPSIKRDEQYDDDDDDDDDDEGWERPRKKRKSAKRGSLKCPDCDRYFTHQCFLRTHRSIVHERRMLCCTICSARMAYKGNMLRHLKNAHQIEAADADSKYEARQMEENESRVWECLDCDKTFTTAALLSEHSSAEHGQNVHSAGSSVRQDDDDDDDDDDDADWERPRKKRKPAKRGSLKCPDCDRYFTHHCLLRTHRAIVHERRMLCCTICNARMAYKGNMLRHLKNAHQVEAADADSRYETRQMEENESRVWECLDCDKTFTSAVLLSEHSSTEHGQNVYSCQICNKTVKNRRRHLKLYHPDDDMRSFTVSVTSNQFAKHQLNHLGMYECPECAESFQFLSQLTRHHANVHVRRMFSCTVCGAKVGYKGNMLRHVATKHPEHPPNSYVETIQNERDKGENQNRKTGHAKRQFKCQKCDKTFASITLFRKHRIVHSMAKKYKCRVCATPFAYRKVLRSHMIHRHPATPLNENEMNDDRNASNKQYECPICKQRYGFKRSLEKHLSTIHPKVKFEFRKVTEQQPQPQPATNDNNAATEVVGNEALDDDAKPDSSVQKIVITESREGHRYQKSICTICNIEFENKWSHTWHRRHVHSLSERSFECYLCNENYKTSGQLKGHFRQVHVAKYDNVYQQYKLKARKCDCGQEFENIAGWIAHRRWHKEQINGRPHKCHICTKAYVERFELKRHLETHTPIACAVCNKPVSQFYMKEHLRRHTDQRKVQCTVCGNFYSDSGKLTRHMRTHTGELPYKCEYCGKNFRQSSSLAVHKRSHTGDYLHHCKPCGRGFGARRELRKHNLRIHGIVVADENNAK